jgi:sugar lactone lactonase YvrE
MSLLLLLSVGAAFAFAEEATDGPTASFLPSDIDSAEDLAPLIAESQPVDLEADTDPAAAEELPHTDLDRPEAEELLEGVFGVEEIEAPAEFFDDLEIEAFRSDHVAVVAPAELGAEPGLLFSTLPLRTVDESGEEAPVDLDLEASEGSLEPANPLVPVQIPTQLAEGISLPGANVTVDLVNGDGDRGASELGDASAFYPNVAADTDLVVAAVPTGFETYTHLRSPEAPTQQKFALDVPAGAELRETNAGGAEVVAADGSRVLSVSAPSAVDAEGSEVPAKIEVEGSSLILSADPSADAAYPILVDPIFDTYNFTGATGPGTTGKDWAGTHSGSQFGTIWGTQGSVIPLAPYGMNAGALVGPTTAGSNAWFNYYVPRYWTDTQAGLGAPTTYIREMKLWNTTYMMPDEAGTPLQYRPAYPSMQMGLWSATKNQFVAYGERFGYQGQWTDGSYVFELKNNPVENTDVKNGGFGIATMASYNTVNRYVNVQQASVELTDQDSPGFGSIGSPSGWMNATAAGKIPFVVSETGLGIYSLKVKQPRAEGGSELITTSNNCVGTSQSPCPRKAESATRTITYSPQSMAQGEHFIEVTASDPVNHASSPSFVKIKVDHSAPELALSGNLTEQGTAGTNLTQYTLNYATKDGDDSAAAALSPIGTAGTAAGQLERPMGIAVDGAGNNWITDRVNNRIVELDKNGTFLRQIVGQWSPEAEVKEPRGIAIGPNGNLWFAEAGPTKRVRQFTPTGSPVSTITNAAFVEPWGVATGPGGVVWVADASAKKVFQFKEDGTLIRTISNLGSSTDVPVGIDVDGFGNGWIATQGTNKVVELSPTGSVLFSFGATGTEAGQFKGPVDLAIAPSGNIFVSDDLNNRIQEFKPDGTFLRQFGAVGSASNQLKEPRAIDVGPENGLLIVDSANRRIARWSHADQDPQSGAAKVEVKVDGANAATNAPGCTTKNCAFNGSWVLKADDYPGGAHKVEVLATDAAGLQTTKTLNIETHGDFQPPAVALSGSMTEQASLGTTRPSYKLKVSATDPGSSEERKSGVASTSIKVDGIVVDSSSPGCPAGGCSITREWTLNSDSYSVGSHKVEATATDAVGKSTTKTLTINIARDTTAPEFSLLDPFYTRPSGWVEQKLYEYTAQAVDPNGYGVTSIQLKIDGTVIKSASGTCPAGNCSRLLGFGQTINMDGWTGGAHPAELIATDGAGNTRKRNWTINVDPSGAISVSEAEDTLEALDATSPVNTVGDPQSEINYEGTAEELELQAEGDLLVAQGSAAPTALPSDTPGELEVEIPTPTADIACPNRPAEESEAPRTGEEEEQLALTVGCEEPSAIPSENELLTPVSVSPVSGVAGESQSVTPNAAAAVARNVSPNVDLVTRPLFDGAMTFTAIRDSNAVESFSWRVRLTEDQTLTLKTSQLAEVAYPGGYVAFTIAAVPAHDAIGTTVPTSLSVQGDVLTLHVEHKSGSYVYPVVGGAGWEGGFQTYEVVMPPETEGEGGEVNEGEFGEGTYREATFGPPESAAGAFVPLEAQGEDVEKKKRRYNFHDCRFEVNGGVSEPPGGSGGGGRFKAEAVVHKCHGEEDGGPYGEYWVLDWATDIHGTYFYKPHGYVWINKAPECKKWGPSEPAKLKCRPDSNHLDKAYKPRMDVLGYYRFAPGNFGVGEGAGNPVCYELDGVLPNYWVTQQNGNKVLEVTWHSYNEWKDPGEPCTWDNLREID